MTTNERLFDAGVIDAWNTAVVARDRVAMIAQLQVAGLSELDASEIVDQILDNPTMYGF